MEIQGKRAVVTGSTKGIGRAVAEALLEEGAQVVITARTRKDVDKVVAELGRGREGRVQGTVCDVSQADEVNALVRFAVDWMGGLDILVNNAGIGVFKPVEELRIEDWRATIGTNLDALYYTCHAVLPHMRRAGGGFIINIGSLAGKNAFAGGSAYNASKFGLIGFSEALMQEVRYDDILVAYIMPGSVETTFGGKEGSPAGWKIAPSDVAEVVLQTLRRPSRCLTSRIEIRPSKPPRKS